jgi:aminoglycoside phosphotransferase (APT) family kinase protein
MNDRSSTVILDTRLLDEITERASSAVRTWNAGASIVDVRPLTGGASSLTFLADVDGAATDHRRVVLKVAPPGLEPVRNRDVLRQGRLMRVLHGQPGVVVPPILFEDRGAPPDVPPFVAMGFVDGECVEPVLDESRDQARFGEIRRRALDAARVLAHIHRVAPATVGLADEPVVGLEEEIDRWTRAFRTVPAELQGECERCADILCATMPAPLPPVVNHGDYRLGNMLCAGDRVTAVIDWEIWSVGDPRVDTTWFTFFTDEAHHPAAPTTDASGMPTAAELLDTYREAGGASLDDLAWFDALTRYKEAAATALLIKRGRKQGALPPSLARMVPALPDLLSQAERLVS